MTQSLAPLELDVSRETLAKLERFSEMAVQWTKKINLISPATIPDIWSRHIVDSAQIFPMVQTSWTRWVDLGSGGGFPGIVVSILADANQTVTLIESDTRKSVFLRAAIRELDLNATVRNERVEHCHDLRADIVSARALAPLSSLFSLTDPIRRTGGVSLFLKGRNYLSEIDEARKLWDFDCETLQSRTDDHARILKIGKVTRRGS